MDRERNRFENTQGMGQTFEVFLAFAKTRPSSVAASKLFSEYVDKIQEVHKSSREYAEYIARSNLNYFAGYYDDRTQRLISHVYRQSLVK